MHYEDLAPYGLLPPADDRLKAVGWLEEGYPFLTGSVDRRVIERLFDFAEDPWYPGFGVFGYRACTLCLEPPYKAPTLVKWKKHHFLGLGRTRRVEVGGGDLYVPGRGCIYITPSLILHFIITHSYSPPAEFCQAVLAAPDMQTAEFLDAIRAVGLAHLGKQ